MNAELLLQLPDGVTPFAIATRGSAIFFTANDHRVREFEAGALVILAGDGVAGFRDGPGAAARGRAAARAARASTCAGTRR